MNDQGRTVGVQKFWTCTAGVQCNQRRIEFYRGRAVIADIEVREISNIVEVRIELPVNDRGLCMNVSSGAFECRGAAIGLSRGSACRASPAPAPSPEHEG